MKLIINADDFGLSDGVNNGIVKAFTDGAVRSTTLLVNAAALEGAAALASKQANLGVGVHLNLTSGSPIIAGSKTLVNSDGNFFKLLEFIAKLKENSFDLTEVENEWRAQIQKAKSLGINITHFDSHHHVHLKGKLFDIALKLAHENNVPLRFGKLQYPQNKNLNVPSTDYFSLKYYEDVSLQNLINILDPYKDKDVSLELMVHPAYRDDGLCLCSSYIDQRPQELKTLTSPEFLQYIHDNKIQLCNYKTL
ncbi:MAG: chitin disaccharide deacetylase [Elusimicrobiota bacterium]|jgi:predicted glycoside hydrolase/deacetylase ChbG (UPF0249 family)|nr:chitin disaccharide deacetylase [Elusimicrobiota bacterium]